MIQFQLQTLAGIESNQLKNDKNNNQSQCRFAYVCNLVRFKEWLTLC